MAAELRSASGAPESEKLSAQRSPHLNSPVTYGAHTLWMSAPLLRSDPVGALNAKARGRGWTFTCYQSLEFEAPKLGAVLRLWQSLASDAKIPARAAFTARALKDVLRDMMICERSWDGTRHRYRCRYVGSNVVNHIGEMTGAFLDEFLPALANERTTACYDTVVEARAPLRFVTRFSMDRINFLSAEFIGAPMASNGVDIDMIMSVTHFRFGGK